MESAVVMAKGAIITAEDLPPGIGGNDHDGSAMIPVPLGASLSQVEREVIRANLAQQKGNKSRTADILGIGRKTLHRKLDEYNLE
jgi:DNA-binding NtrC family response regulator